MIDALRWVLALALWALLIYEIIKEMKGK